MKKRSYSLLFTLILAFGALLPEISHGEKPEPRIDLQSVKVGGEIGRRMDITVQNNLLVLDADQDFLKPFEERNRKSGYIGLGKLIDSLVRFAANIPNDQLLALKEHVIDRTIQTQENDGYIGMFVPERRMWALWDIHEMTYIVNGLLSDYEYFEKRDSLAAAEKLMNYIIRRWKEQPDGMDETGITIFMAVTGLEETLLRLYEQTGNSLYLDFCVTFRRLPEWNYPIELGRWGKIGGHAYAFFQRCLAQLRLYQIKPDARLLKQTQRVIDFLTKENGLLINGVCSQHECWHNNQDGTAGLGETCATAYMIRVLDELIRINKDSLYGDIMERAIYNGLFAAQSPDGRKLRYYVPFEGERVYFNGDTYCCPCNYRRIIAELPSMVYYRMDGGIAVNLYTPSKATIDLDNGHRVTIQQETDYPNSGVIHLTINPENPHSFPLRLRIPRWSEGGTVTLNDRTIAMEAPSGRFFQLERTWKAGDRVTVNLPMPIRLVKGRQAQAGRVAVMRGPQLFCLNPKQNEGLENVDLKRIAIDPETLDGPEPDETVRPNGMACKIKGWKEIGFSTGGNHNLDLLLTEFPDPDGRATYFLIRKMGQVGVEDELVRIKTSD